MTAIGCQFMVRGLPAAQGSKRHVGRGVMVEQAGPKLKSWREAVRSEASRVLELDAAAGPIDGPVQLTLRFYLPRPKAHYRTGKHAHELRGDAPLFVATTPDVDKLARSTTDALTDAGMWRDDRQVAELVASKVYTDSAYGCLITVGALL